MATTDGARTVKSARLQFIVTGLASSTPYEFRFCAVNELGSGPWSEPSAAVATTLLGANYPKSQALLTLDQWNVRFMQGDPSLQVKHGKTLLLSLYFFSEIMFILCMSFVGPPVSCQGSRHRNNG